MQAFVEWYREHGANRTLKDLKGVPEIQEALKEDKDKVNQFIKTSRF